MFKISKQILTNKYPYKINIINMPGLKKKTLRPKINPTKKKLKQDMKAKTLSVNLHSKK